MKKTVFTGAGVAIVTPFTEDNKVNYDKLAELIEFQIANKTDSIIICGTTGEGSTLDHDEHSEAIRFTVDVVNKRIPVIAGTGSNDTNYAVKLSNEAEKAGVDALLSVTPYYNKTSQRGLVKHFNYIADRVSVPVILYNVPSRTGVNILPETYYELSHHERIVGTKEANGDISSVAKTISLCGPDFSVYSGNDDQVTALMSLGGKGSISVLSNILPEVAHSIPAKYLEGDYKGSAELQIKYLTLCNALFSDVNPIPVKEAMNMMGMNVGDCRLPLYKMTEPAKEALRKVLANYGLVD